MQVGEFEALEQQLRRQLQDKLAVESRLREEQQTLQDKLSHITHKLMSDTNGMMANMGLAGAGGGMG